MLSTQMNRYGGICCTWREMSVSLLLSEHSADSCLEREEHQWGKGRTQFRSRGRGEQGRPWERPEQACTSPATHRNDSWC